MVVGSPGAGSSVGPLMRRPTDGPREASGFPTVLRTAAPLRTRHPAGRGKPSASPDARERASGSPLRRMPGAARAALPPARPAASADGLALRTRSRPERGRAVRPSPAQGRHPRAPRRARLSSFAHALAFRVAGAARASHAPAGVRAGALGTRGRAIRPTPREEQREVIGVPWPPFNQRAFRFVSRPLTRVVHESGKASSALASSAYITGEEREAITGEIYRPRPTDRVAWHETTIPPGAPEELRDPQTLWASIELIDTSVGAQMCRRGMYTFPVGTTLDEMVAIARAWAERRAAEGVCIEWALHVDAGICNPHVHFLEAMNPVASTTYDPKNPSSVWGPKSTQRDLCRAASGAERWMTARERQAANADGSVAWEQVYKWTRPGKRARRMTASEAAVANAALGDDEAPWQRQRDKKGKLAKPVRKPQPWNRLIGTEHAKEDMKAIRAECAALVWDPAIAKIHQRAVLAALAEAPDPTDPAAAASVPDRPAKTDPRSYADQGLDVIPMVHEGHGPGAGDRRRENVLIDAVNDARSLARAAERTVSALEDVTYGVEPVPVAVVEDAMDHGADDDLPALREHDAVLQRAAAEAARAPRYDQRRRPVTRALRDQGVAVPQPDASAVMRRVLELRAWVARQRRRLAEALADGRHVATTMRDWDVSAAAATATMGGRVRAALAAVRGDLAQAAKDLVLTPMREAVAKRLARTAAMRRDDTTSSTSSWQPTPTPEPAPSPSYDGPIR